MNDLSLTYGGIDYLDRLPPLLDGTVKPAGISLRIVPFIDPWDLFRRVVWHSDFDAAEMSFSTYADLVSRGDDRYIAIPFFPSRAFRHGDIYVHRDSGISQPADLREKKVGIPQYQMTAALWQRALVSDRIWFDGFECFRLQDVSNVRADPYAKFVETALRRRADRIPRKPRVSLASIEELLLSANRAFPLVTVHREQRNPEVCSIGRVIGVNRGRVSLLEITPDATWEKKPANYRLSEIARVNFGGDYEDALAIVGGSPPQANIRLETDLRTCSQSSRARASQPSR